jgi:glycosyltransferase involved in cell wall biosynthesis
MEEIAVLVSALTRQGPSLGALAFQKLHTKNNVNCTLITRWISLHEDNLKEKNVVSSTYLKMWFILSTFSKAKTKISFDLKVDVVNILSKGRSIIYLRANNRENYTDTFGKYRGVLLYEFHKLLLHRADVIYALSKTMKEEYRDTSRIYQKIKVIPNFIDERLDHELIKRKNTFLIVASIIPRKRVFETVEAFISEFHGTTDVSLTVIGDGVLRVKLEEYVSKCDFKFNIEFITESIDPSHYFAFHEYFILMSLSEGLSRASLEAANSGCKLLLSNIDVHKEYFGETALLLDNFKDLKKALRDCYDIEENYLCPSFPLDCAQSLVWTRLTKTNKK